MTKLLTDDQFKTAYLAPSTILSISEKILIQRALLRFKDNPEYDYFTYNELVEEIQAYAPGICPEREATITYLNQLGFRSADTKVEDSIGYLEEIAYKMRGLN